MAERLTSHVSPYSHDMVGLSGWLWLRVSWFRTCWYWARSRLMRHVITSLKHGQLNRGVHQGGEVCACTVLSLFSPGTFSTVPCVTSTAPSSEPLYSVSRKNWNWNEKLILCILYTVRKGNCPWYPMHFDFEQKAYLDTETKRIPLYSKHAEKKVTHWTMT
jgi:hypothetical protein